MISVFYNVYLKKFGGKKVIDIKQYFLYLISTYYAHFWVRRDELQSFKHENHIVRLLNCVTFELFCFASTIFIRDHDMTLAVMTEVEKKKKKEMNRIRELFSRDTFPRWFPRCTKVKFNGKIVKSNLQSQV